MSHCVIFSVGRSTTCACPHAHSAATTVCRIQAFRQPGVVRGASAESRSVAVRAAWEWGTWRGDEVGGVRGEQRLQPGGQLAAALGARLQPRHPRPQQQRRVRRLDAAREAVVA